VRSTKYGVIRVNMSVAISERRDKYAKHAIHEETMNLECNMSTANMNDSLLVGVMYSAEHTVDIIY
jgi:hypothetical protein